MEMGHDLPKPVDNVYFDLAQDIFSGADWGGVKVKDPNDFKNTNSLKKKLKGYKRCNKSSKDPKVNELYSIHSYKVHNPLIQRKNIMKHMIARI